jgi:hypothetical protein
MKHAAACLLTILSSLMFAQVNTGSISGTVIDPSNASIPGAKVMLTNEETGVALPATTSAAGNYVFTPLQPGRYSLAVEAAGFKRIERKGLLLQIGGKLGVDIQMELGALGESVQVTAESPLLTVTNANVGHVIDRQKVMELPLPGRDTVRLVQIAPGVGGINSAIGDLRLGGGRIRLLEFYVDGAPTTTPSDGRVAAFPSVDAIAEFKVETNNLSAEYGRLSGGAISVQTRSGTNEPHGSLYYFGRNSALDANGWDANRRGAAKGNFGIHQFGGTFGGPVSLGKWYDGRNRTFFFFNYDGLRQTAPLIGELDKSYQASGGELAFATMPTELERNGDFSKTTNIQARAVTVYDPLTYDKATNRRQPFAGNRIPANRFDPVAKYLLPLFELPNRTPDPDGRNNFGGLNRCDFTRNDFTIRLDQNFGSNHRMYVRVTRNRYIEDPNYWAGPATYNRWNTWLYETGSTVNWNWTATPTFILTVQAGASPRSYLYNPVLKGFDPTSIPFADNVKRELDRRYVPYINFEKVTGLGTQWHTTALNTRYFSGTVAGTKIWTRHTVKFGYDYKPAFLNNLEPQAPSGTANFSGAWTGLNQQATLNDQGSGLASFLLGLPDSFSFDNGTLGWAIAFKNHALFVQDDFKVTRRLTLNFGLRWEYESPMTERYNRMAFYDYGADNGYKIRPGYDFTREVIGTGQVPAGSPVPNLSGPFIGGMGIVASAQHPGRGVMRENWKNYGPRFGFAYQLLPSTVLRSGIGLIYASFMGNASGTGSLSVYDYFRTKGVALITPDAGQTIAATLSNPFPNDLGLLQGTTDPNRVILRYMGDINRGYQFNHKPSREISYNLGLQHTIRNKWLLEASFVGNRGLNLYAAVTPVGSLDPGYLSLGATLERQVSNPFAGAGLQDNGNLLTRPTIAYKYLLMPQPHLVGGTGILRYPVGQSQYMAGYFKVERRFHSGLSLLVSYTLSKLIETTTLGQNGQDFSESRALSNQDAPQKLVVTYLYELPVGRGRKWMGNPQTAGEKVMEGLVGGWKLSGFTMLMSGYPIAVSQSDGWTGGMGYGPHKATVAGVYHNNTGVEGAVGLPGQAAGRYMNLEAFKVTGRYDFGNVATLPDLRMPRYNQTDLAIGKEFHFGEKNFVEIRCETRNFFNHPVFGGLTSNIQNANFGLFNSTVNYSRNVQMGARFVF